MPNTDAETLGVRQSVSFGRRPDATNPSSANPAYAPDVEKKHLQGSRIWISGSSPEAFSLPQPEPAASWRRLSAADPLLHPFAPACNRPIQGDIGRWHCQAIC